MCLFDKVVPRRISADCIETNAQDDPSRCPYCRNFLRGSVGSGLAHSRHVSWNAEISAPAFHPSFISLNKSSPALTLALKGTSRTSVIQASPGDPSCKRVYKRLRVSSASLRLCVSPRIHISNEVISGAHPSPKGNQPHICHLSFSRRSFMQTSL